MPAKSQRETEHPPLTERALRVLDKVALQQLLDALNDQGFTVIGPTVRDSAVVYEEISSLADLPVGRIDEQHPGSYRLESHADDARLFGHTVGPHSFKQFLFPSAVRLWRARRHSGGFDCEPEAAVPPRLALIGVRACELAAIDIQDRVFTGGSYTDPIYAARRNRMFVVAVNCGRAGGTCFCASMGTGPKARTGFDIALTEIVDGATHEFVAEAGSEAGAAMLGALPGRAAEARDRDRADAIVSEAASSMGRHLDTAGLRELLFEHSEHPRWDEVAKRCLSCANCTMVCPTCFCTTVEDVTDLTGDTAERWRKWDSCFTLGFSYIHGGSVRVSVKSRYRQWMTHKLASWLDQFGTSGCVGCGRCITWCPVGIDITEEAAAIRGSVQTNAAELTRTES